MKFNKLLNLLRGVFAFFIVTSVVSCSTHNNPANIEEDGGPDSRIVGKYKFTSSSEYLDFYRIFKRYNSERFLCPIDFHENSFKYYFKTEGIKLTDFESNRYDLDFDFMNMYFEFEFQSYKITFETFDVKNNYFSNESSLSYELLESYNRIQVHYFIDDFRFASTRWINNDLVSNEKFIIKLENLTLYLKEGIKYVF